MPISENFDARAEVERRENPLTREEVRGMLDGLAASIRGETDALKSDEKPLTLADTKTAIRNIVESIKSLVGNLENKFADKTDISRAINNILRDIGSRKYVDEIWAKQIAGDAVPPSLRGLDTDATRKAGDTLKLASNPAGDSAYWGTVEGGIITTIEEVWAFGVKSIAGAVVTMYEGHTMKGTQVAGSVAEQELTVTEQGQIAYLTYSLLTGLSTWGIANADNFPLSGSNTYVKPMQSFNLVDGVASKLFTYHKGVVQVDSAYA